MINATRYQPGKLFLAAALCMLILGTLFGVLASQSYWLPGFMKNSLNFSALRPMHVSSVMFWILLGATGCVYASLSTITKRKSSSLLERTQLALWILAIAGILYSYLTKKFGGREYWEFDPAWALPIACAWLLFLVAFISRARTIKNWPVYVWMWMTGITFFLFSFSENYLWMFPYFREHFVTDMTVQWKVNGSLVGSWNQLIYGTSFYLMDRISGDKNTGHKPIAFGMYFLGLFNLMFNCGHHIYTLPTEKYVRYVGYAVSMTEWLIFARIIYTWRQSLNSFNKHAHSFPYRFLIASEIWVFLSLTQALFMSIPALNRYTHGTHIAVAHAMGTTIGINSMILLAACFEFFGTGCTSFSRPHPRLNKIFWTMQISLFVLWSALNIAGIQKGIWQMSAQRGTFAAMMSSLQPWFVVFVLAGFVLMICLSSLAATLLRSYITCELGFRKKKLDNHQIKNEYHIPLEV